MKEYWRKEKMMKGNQSGFRVERSRIEYKTYFTYAQLIRKKSFD